MLSLKKLPEIIIKLEERWRHAAYNLLTLGRWPDPKVMAASFNAFVLHSPKGTVEAWYAGKCVANISRRPDSGLTQRQVFLSPA
jgi:hypothetical protein